jgi:Zinc-binding loop region of homing endonuclease
MLQDRPKHAVKPYEKPTRVVEGLTPKQHKELLELIATRTQPPTPDGCLLVSPINGRFSLNSKGYVQIKVAKLDNSLTTSNSKVQLHQIMAWNSSDTTLQSCIRSTKLEISHLCQFKNCANDKHLVAETSFQNKQRWTCPCIVYIARVEKLNCVHGPRYCIPGPWARKNAFWY